MERHRKLDVARPSATWRIVVVCFLILAGFQAGIAQSSPANANLQSQVGQLYAQQRWQEVVRLAATLASPSADVQFHYGMALAQLGELEQAKSILRIAWQSYSRDKRFPTELAGIEFKQKHYSVAKSLLRAARRIDPNDSYPTDFLATVYFLEGNQDAALKYWNAVEKPRIGNVVTDPQPRLNPLLLDHAFTFAGGSALRLDELWTSEARIRALGVFPAYRFDLAPRNDGTFDLTFHPVEQNGFGNGKWQAALSLFRGIFQQTIDPEYSNIQGSAANIRSLVRWEAQRRRAFASLSGPWEHDPKWRYSVSADLRNENWQLRGSPGSASSTLGALNVRKQSIGAEIQSIVSWRWQWSTGFGLSHRDFRNVLAGTPLPNNATTGGYELKHLATVNYGLFRFPEYRLVIGGKSNIETGRNFSGTDNLFSKLQSEVHVDWQPGPRNRYEVEQRVSVGEIFGQAPLDEMHLVGLDPDGSFLLRAHIATLDGRKGNAPVVNGYFLSNSEAARRIYSNGLLSLSAGPFLDLAKIFDTTYIYESKRLLCDIGPQLKIRALGVGFALSYGRDLRSGTNAIYLSAR